MKDLEEYFTNAMLKEQVVTLFMLTYKRPNYLGLAIESVLKQTYRNFYLIVLDNCSGDATPNVVTTFSDERLIYVERQSTVETSNSQFAFDKCITKYLIVLHDDDIYDEDYLENVVSKIEHSEFVAVSVRANYINDNGDIIERSKSLGGDRVFQGNQYFVNLIRSGGNFQSMIYPAVIYRHSFFCDRKKFVDADAGPAGDQLMWLQAERFGGKLCILDKTLLNYRRHDNQMSSRSMGTMEIKLYYYLCHHEYYRQIIEKYKRCLAKIYLRSILSILYRFTCYKNISVTELKMSLDSICIDVIEKCLIGKFTILCVKLIKKNPKLISMIYAKLRALKHIASSFKYGLL